MQSRFLLNVQHTGIFLFAVVTMYLETGHCDLEFQQTLYILNANAFFLYPKAPIWVCLAPSCSFQRHCKMVALSALLFTLYANVCVCVIQFLSAAASASSPSSSNRRRRLLSLLRLGYSHQHKRISMRKYICSKSHTFTRTIKIYHKSWKHKLNSIHTTLEKYIVHLTFNFYNIFAFSIKLNLIYTRNYLPTCVDCDCTAFCSVTEQIHESRKYACRAAKDQLLFDFFPVNYKRTRLFVAVLMHWDAFIWISIFLSNCYRNLTIVRQNIL